MPSTIHPVTLSEDYYLQDTIATQAQWREVLAAAGVDDAALSRNPSVYAQCDDCPVESISWD